MAESLRIDPVAPHAATGTAAAGTAPAESPTLGLSAAPTNTFDTAVTALTTWATALLEETSTAAAVPGEAVGTEFSTSEAANQANATVPTDTAENPALTFGDR